jgi:hypothetical protein
MRVPGRRPRSSQIERDLARLADGTLKGSRRDRVEELVARSPELQARLRDQRRAVAAVRSVAKIERAPLALHMQHQALIRGQRRWAPAVALGLAGTVGALLWTIAALGGGQAALTVAQAATIAVRPATTSVADPPDDQVTLPGVQAAGMPFPYWEDRFDWHTAGTRTDRMEGRVLTTVFYQRRAERIAYTIVSGNALPPVAAERTTVRAGTLLAVSSSGGRPVVTWLRRGHTCVLSGGQGVSLGALLKLAGWRSHGQIPF